MIRNTCRAEAFLARRPQNGFSSIMLNRAGEASGSCELAHPVRHMRSKLRRIIIIGSGPSAIYALKELVPSSAPLCITIVESKSKAGVGNPYDPATTDAAMLANIASVELPPVIDRLSDWLLAQEDGPLAALGLSRDGIDEHAFVPRIAIGAYYANQLQALVAAASKMGHRIDIKVESRVVDVVESADEISVTITGADGDLTTVEADVVVVATGHGDGQASPSGIAAPAYPLEMVPPDARRIGILGTSLSAIDVAVGVALQFGNFDEDDQIWRPHDACSGDRPLSITMMSRRGLLPEADFHAPLPYAPLAWFRPEALEDEPGASSSLLDRAFDLFKQEIAACDPEYAATVGLAEATPDDMAARYFGPRLASDPFEHAAANLAEAMEGHRARRVCAWRYAILRMHEPFEALLPRFSDEDRARFDAGLKGMFIDNYAAVPHRSIRRLLALHDAGVLAIERLSPDYTIARTAAEIVVSGSHVLRFDQLYDARGQRPRRAVELPFPTLRLRLLAQGLRDGEADLDAAHIEVDESFALPTAPGCSGTIYVTAVPYMLHERPFSQGLTAARDIGVRVGRAILAESVTATNSVEPDTTLEDLIESPLLRDDLLLVNGEVVLSPAA